MTLWVSARAIFSTAGVINCKRFLSERNQKCQHNKNYLLPRQILRGATSSILSFNFSYSLIKSFIFQRRLRRSQTSRHFKVLVSISKETFRLRMPLTFYLNFPSTLTSQILLIEVSQEKFLFKYEIRIQLISSSHPSILAICRVDEWISFMAERRNSKWKVNRKVWLFKEFLYVFSIVNWRRN